jgi:hypothetical protein
MIRTVFPDLGGCRVDFVKIAKKIQMCKPLLKKKPRELRGFFML